jgi:hypothetical protein
MPVSLSDDYSEEPAIASEDALAMSPDAPLLRLTVFDYWTILFYRGLGSASVSSA